MPLTISHPIAVAPLWYLSGKRLDLPALITGAMIPDITYFLWLRPVGNIGHSATGIALQGVPAGLALLVIFALVMAGPLRALFPPLLARLIPNSYRFIGLARFACIVFSIAIGAATHVFWDSFTHQGAVFVERWPALQSEAAGLPVYKLLQYGSGIFGPLAITLWARQATRKTRSTITLPRLINPKAAWLIIGAVTMITTGLALSQVAPLSGHKIIVQSVIGLISGSWLGVLVYALLFKAGLLRTNGSMTR